MRRLGLLRVAVTLGAVLVLCQSVYADWNGSFNMNYTRNESFENGIRKSKTDRFNQNYYFGIQRSVTPMFSYRLFLRTNFTDTLSDIGGVRQDSYHRAFEPTIDLSLRNHVYSVSAGYRRTENWNKARLTNKSRSTTTYYYSRFTLTPWELPSLTLEADRRKDFDHLPVSTLDVTTTRYSAGSLYRYAYKGFDTSYNMTFTHAETETPLGVVSKTVSDTFGGLFSAGYSRPLFGDKANMSTRYQANYGRSSVEQFVTQTGSVVFERTPAGGFYAKGPSLALRDVATLGPQGALRDDVVTIGIGINLADNTLNGLYHNVGVQVFSSAQTVDRLYVYVVVNPGGDPSTDANLTNAANWEVYTSNTNTLWTQVIPITTNPVPVVLVDPVNNVYRYELTFAPQNALFFKAVNLSFVNAAGVTNVDVTEVEALGTDFVPSTGKLKNTGVNFTQGWNFNLSMRPTEKVDVTFSYYINQADQDPPSVTDSMADFLENIVSKTRKTEGNLRRNVSRTYGPGVTWRTHRLLTTNVRITRSEVFDNLGTLDASSNNYSLSLHSSPIQNVDATLSIIRSDSFTFGDRANTTDSYVLTVGTRLYREVNMVFDVGHTESEAHTTDLITKSTFARGSVDARITKELFTNFAYGITRTSEATSATSQEASLVVAYRLGRLMSMTGNFRFSDNDGATTTTEGMSIDWLPVRVVQLNLSYQHQRAPGPVTSDSISSFVRWNVKKFLDFQVSYVYQRSKSTTETENRSISMTLNGRFR